MADNLHKQPRKGILKNSSSFEGNGRQREKETKWDEMNILATLHPKDKDYGHMKIEEPKTPFTHYNEGDSGDEYDGLDADLLAKKIELSGSDLPKALIEVEEEAKSESEDEDISPEEREKRKLFEMKRKKHYNEYYAVKLARKLMQNDDVDDDTSDEDDDIDNAEEGSHGKKVGRMEATTEGDNANVVSTKMDMSLEEEQASGD